MNRSLKFLNVFLCFCLVVPYQANSTVAIPLTCQFKENEQENSMESAKMVNRRLITTELINEMTIEKLEEIKRIRKEEEARLQAQLLELERKKVHVELRISYYTSLDCENTKHGAVDAQGDPLQYGTIAVPSDIPLGSEFYIEGNKFVAKDRGSKIKWIDNNTIKIDMFIPRNKGESDGDYFKRVNNMGIKKSSGYYIPYEKEKGGN